MLQRQIEVRHAGFAHGIDQRVIEITGIQVQQPDPVDAFSNCFNQGNDGSFALTLISSKGSQVLGDKDDFFSVEFIDLTADVFDGSAALWATKGRDGAESTVAIAAFGDLHIRPR